MPPCPSAPQGFVNFAVPRSCVPLRASGPPHRYAVPPYPSAPQGLRVPPHTSRPLNSSVWHRPGAGSSVACGGRGLGPGRAEAAHPSGAERSKPKQFKAGSLLLQQVTCHACTARSSSVPISVPGIPPAGWRFAPGEGCPVRMRRKCSHVALCLAPRSPPCWEGRRCQADGAVGELGRCFCVTQGRSQA